MEEIPNSYNVRTRPGLPGPAYQHPNFLQQASERASISTGTGWISGFGLFLQGGLNSLHHGKAAVRKGCSKLAGSTFSFGFGSGPGGRSNTASLQADYIQYPRVIDQAPVLPDLPRQTDRRLLSPCYTCKNTPHQISILLLMYVICTCTYTTVRQPPPTTARSPRATTPTPMLSRTSQCNLAPGSLVAEYEYDDRMKNKKRTAAEGNRVRPVRPFLVASSPRNRAEYVGRAGCGGPRWQLHCV